MSPRKVLCAAGILNIMYSLCLGTHPFHSSTCFASGACLCLRPAFHACLRHNFPAARLSRRGCTRTCCLRKCTERADKETILRVLAQQLPRCARYHQFSLCLSTPAAQGSYVSLQAWVAPAVARFVQLGVFLRQRQITRSEIIMAHARPEDFNTQAFSCRLYCSRLRREKDFTLHVNNASSCVLRCRGLLLR